MSGIVRLELSTAGDELVILEQLDDRDLRLVIMDGEGNETDARIRSSLLQSSIASIRAGAEA